MFPHKQYVSLLMNENGICEKRDNNSDWGVVLTNEKHVNKHKIFNFQSSDNLFVSFLTILKIIKFLFNYCPDIFVQYSCNMIRLRWLTLSTPISCLYVLNTHTLFEVTFAFKIETEVYVTETWNCYCQQIYIWAQWVINWKNFSDLLFKLLIFPS